MNISHWKIPIALLLLVACACIQAGCATFLLRAPGAELLKDNNVEAELLEC